ncbi:putative 3-hydroxyacyldehydrogenase type-2 [Phaeomoniella chlamydospora]|uniref:Putative 3-hydroxyacyldehydrogenase type-2 n=1 Tax=Phaeomoniella chlamydospora TaxID=158046 RepID=A0A0G2HAH7_PHACM|nr:putative 3-hydroxyacyldehydrogenase type-2 [Phaeomoniella chlamydospora]
MQYQLTRVSTLRSSGLGLSTAIHLLSHNANVSLLDLNPPPPSPPTYASTPIPSTLYALLTEPSRTLFTSTDVTSSDSIASALTSTITWIDTKTHAPLGGVICCAGISLPALALPRQPTRTPSSTLRPPPNLMSMQSFDRVLSINLRGTVDLIRQTLPHLSSLDPETLSTLDPDNSDEERGCIILVSSLAAFEGQVGQLSYSASKGAVASIVLPLARELGSKAGIRVVGIAPGLFESGMTFPEKKPKPKPKPKKEATSSSSSPSSSSSSTEDVKKAEEEKPARGFNPGMIEFPMRLGRGEEFAGLVKSILENSMINGSVIRLDGGVRMPSRL